MQAFSEVVHNVAAISHEEWLEHRKTGLGGSDAGAIMGVSPYKGMFSVWADKNGQLPPVEDNEAMRQGRDFEDYVARRFAERTGKKVRRERRMLRSVQHPCMLADIDRRLIGERAGLECKTSKDIYLKRYKNGDFPMEYYCQCLHYMVVTGWEAWYLAVLVYGTGLLVFKLVRGERTEPEEGVDAVVSVDEDLEALASAEEAFWRDYMLGGAIPPADGLRATREALGLVYAASDGTAVDADDEADGLLCELAQLKRDKKAIEARILAGENQIKAAMGQAEIMTGTAASATWKGRTQRRISEKLIRQLYPEVDISKIKQEVSSRTFEVHEEREDD